MAPMAEPPSLLTWPQHEPLVRDFKWEPGVTPGATWTFMLTSAALYPALVLSLNWLLTPRPPAPRRPFPLGPLPALHNLLLCLGSLAMFLGALQASIVEAHENAWMWGNKGQYFWLICFPKGTKPVGRVFFWSYVYYLSKFYELLDTLILVLKGKPLTLLHVYHHATVIAMCFFWLQYSQSLQTIGLLTNTGIHVLMYYYFFMHSLGVPPPWKRFVTNSQIIQFVFSGVMSVPLVWEQVTSKEGCAGFGAWAFNVAFNLSLLALFVDFHRRNYGKRKAAKAAQEKEAKKDQ